MTTTDIIKAVAELDGRDYCPLDKGVDEDGECRRCGKKYHSSVHIEPRYLTSRDAIVLVITKTITEDEFDKFVDALVEINEGVGCSARDLLCGFNTNQLCEALLRATGKWID